MDLEHELLWRDQTIPVSRRFAAPQDLNSLFNDRVYFVHPRPSPSKEILCNFNHEWVNDLQSLTPNKILRWGAVFAVLPKELYHHLARWTSSTVAFVKGFDPYDEEENKIRNSLASHDQHPQDLPDDLIMWCLEEKFSQFIRPIRDILANRIRFNPPGYNHIAARGYMIMNCTEVVFSFKHKFEKTLATIALNYCAQNPFDKIVPLKDLRYFGLLKMRALDFCRNVRIYNGKKVLAIDIEVQKFLMVNQDNTIWVTSHKNCLTMMENKFQNFLDHLGHKYITFFVYINQGKNFYVLLYTRVVYNIQIIIKFL